MGWIVMVAIKPLVEALPRGSLIMLFAGGLAYSLGTVFYLWKRLPYHHAVWHLFRSCRQYLPFLRRVGQHC